MILEVVVAVAVVVTRPVPEIAEVARMVVM